jgi:hypothetical protein
MLPLDVSRVSRGVSRVCTGVLTEMRPLDHSSLDHSSLDHSPLDQSPLDHSPLHHSPPHGSSHLI